MNKYDQQQHTTTIQLQDHGFVQAHIEYGGVKHVTLNKQYDFFYCFLISCPPLGSLCPFLLTFTVINTVACNQINQIEIEVLITYEIM